MKKFASATILLGSVFAFSALAGEWTGFVGDAKCAAKHAAATEKDVACAKACIKGGSDPVLIVGDKVMHFDGDSKAKAVEHAGHKVTVSGDLSGDAIKIDSIKMAE